MTCLCDVSLYEDVSAALFQSVGNIYKGLAQSGAWGCFDEFNRISVEVLSVIAVQVKSIQDAIRDKRKRFIFQVRTVTVSSRTPDVCLYSYVSTYTNATSSPR